MTNFNSATTWPPVLGNSSDTAPDRSRHQARSFPSWKANVLLFLSLLLCGMSSPSFAAADSKGTDFWLTFPGNYTPGSTTLTLFITGDVATTGTVSIASLSFTAPFTVTPGAVTSVVVPAGAELFTSDAIANNGIHITSVQEVTVYGLSRQQYTTDAYLALPTEVLGTQYVNLGYLNTAANDLVGTQFAIVGTVNGTVVTITPTVTAGTRVANGTYSITLNQGQTYLLRSAGAYPSDLSGTIISATQPIAVFGSNRCANVPHDHAACDYLVEQLPPTTAWGKQFVSVPLKTRLNGDTFRFLAATNNTEVRVNGTLVATLNRGQYHERIIAGSAQITATQPILVAQYSNGSSYDNVVSDPFMMLITPLEQFLGSYTVTTPATGFSGNYINVVVPSAAVGTVRLDGVLVPAASFSAIGSSGYSGAQLTVSLGAHRLTGGLYPIGAFVYGFDAYDSYGYPGGQSFAPVATVSSLALSPATGTAQTGSSYCVAATVKDQFNNPVVGVRVDFAVSGANTTSGFATTDANGVAPFCYVGSHAGTDNIVASIGALSRSAQVTWSSTCNIQLTTTVTNAGCGIAGAISLAVQGGTAPYTYQWLGPNGFAATTKDLSNLAAGLYTVTVTDAAQCSATAQATITTTMTDTTPPVVVAAGFETSLVNGTRTIIAADIDYGSYDDCSGIASMTISPSTFTCANVGPNDVTLTVTDKAGNMTTKTVTVLVKDNTPPVILAAGFTLALRGETRTIVAADIDYGSYDDCGSIASMTISPSTFTCANLGPNEVTLTVTDNAGNVASKTVTILVVDDTAPTILAAGFTTTLSGGTRTIVAADIDYGSYDNCSGIASMTISPSTFTCANVGPNDVTLTVTDKAGNMTTRTVTVVVVADATCTSTSSAVARTSSSTRPLGDAPEEVKLQAYPNPTTDQAVLSFLAVQASSAQVLVYNALGQLVTTLYAGPVVANQRYSFTLDSRALPSGIYSCQLHTAGQTQLTRLVVVK
jgi:hypothetical protein